MDIEYIKGDKNIVADKISIFPLNFNQETTQESNYKKVNSVRNKWHRRNTWKYFSYYF